MSRTRRENVFRLRCLAPDLDHRQYIPASSLASFFCSEMPQQYLLPMIAVPVDEATTEAIRRDTAARRPLSAVTVTASNYYDPSLIGILAKLPLELLLYLAEFMDMQSLYNFRFTNRFFWTFLRQPHRKSFRRTLAPWANTALFLVDQKAMKLPPFLERTCPNLAPDNRPRNIYEAANIFRDVKPFSVSVPHYTGVPTLKLLSPLLRKQYYPPDKDWVLRNHVTKEYVQAKGLTEAKPSEHEWPDVYFHMPDDVDSDYDEQDSDYVYDGDNWVENSDEEAEQVRKQEEREVSLAKTPERVLKLIEDLIDRREIIQHGKPGSGRVDAMHPLGFGLGHVLALKILWSGGAHLVRRRLMIHGCYLPGAAMGPWAGHTFDVVTNETLTAELGRDPDDGTKVSDQEDLEWRDITASVRTDLLMMYLVNDWDVMPPPRDVAKAAGGRKKFGKLLELLKERRRRAAV